MTERHYNEIEKAALVGWVIIGGFGAGLLNACAQTWNRGEMQTVLRSTIAFASARHDSTADPSEVGGLNFS